jgi:hypothetical protein
MFLKRVSTPIFLCHGKEVQIFVVAVLQGSFTFLSEREELYKNMPILDGMFVCVCFREND